MLGDAIASKKKSCWKAALGRNTFFWSRKLLIVFHLKMVFGLHAWWTHFAFCGESLRKEFLCWETTLPSLRLSLLHHFFKTINMSLRVEYPWTFLSYCPLSPADHFVQTHSLTELSKLCRGKIAGQMIPETNRCLPQPPHLCLMIISFQKSELWNRISTPVPYILCLLFTVSETAFHRLANLKKGKTGQEMLLPEEICAVCRWCILNWESIAGWELSYLPTWCQLSHLHNSTEIAPSVTRLH